MYVIYNEDKSVAIDLNAMFDRWIDDNFFSRSLLGRIKWLLKRVLSDDKCPS